MTYNQLIETISLIVENDSIMKKGLTLFYELNEKQIDDINELLYHQSNPFTNVPFTPMDEFEVMLGGILVKFKKIQ